MVCRLLFMINSRHSFSTILIANGENVKVVQELMRHARSRCTLEVYSQARIVAKRQAQQRVVQMILPEETDVRDPCWRAARKSTGGERVCSEIAVLGVSWRVARPTFSSSYWCDFGPSKTTAAFVCYFKKWY